MERLGYGTNFGDDHDDDGDVEQTHDQQGYRGETGDTYEPLYDLGPDSLAWADHSLERPQDAVDHQADDKVAGQAAYIAARVGYRYRARLSRQGEQWSPPDTKDYAAPVFVRVSDLQRWDGEPETE